jgi:RNA polymerase sigma-70 factor (ECF subfamily)
MSTFFDYRFKVEARSAPGLFVGPAEGVPRGGRFWAVKKREVSTLPTVEELRVGGDRAWAAFFDHFEGMIRSIAAWPRWHFDAHTSEDAVQMIKIGIVHSIARLQDQQSLTAFVKRICVNRCIDLLRKQLRDQGRLVSLGHWNEDGEWEDIDVAAGDEFDPVRALQRTERVAVLRRAMEQLDADSQSCLRQFYVEGLSYKDMAARQGVAVNTVGSRLSRCLDRLRALLEAAEDPPERG